MGPFSLVLILALALPLLGFIGGVLLYREQLLGLRLVQVFFALQLLLGLVLLIGGGVGAFVYMAPSGAWLAYLFMSQRVRNTYSNVRPEAVSDVFR
jgi:hypothetical protein